VEDPSQSAVNFEKAFRLFEAQHDDPGTLLAWSGLVDSMLLAWGNHRPLASWFAWLEAWLGKNRAFPSLEIEARVAKSAAGIIRWTLPHRPDAKEWLDRAVRAAQETGNGNLQIPALTYSLMHFAWMGDLGMVYSLSERLQELTRSNTTTPLNRVMGKIIDSWAKLFLPATNKNAFSSAEEGIEIAEKIGIHTLDSLQLPWRPVPH
jgi:hypothetical protein